MRTGSRPGRWRTGSPDGLPQRPGESPLFLLSALERKLPEAFETPRFGKASGGELLDPEECLRQVQPILVQFPPGVSDTMFVLERRGRLLRLPWRKEGEVQLALDISARVGEVEVENGALGSRFTPSSVTTARRTAVSCTCITPVC